MSLFYALVEGFIRVGLRSAIIGLIVPYKSTAAVMVADEHISWVLFAAKHDTCRSIPDPFGALRGWSVRPASAGNAVTGGFQPIAAVLRLAIRCPRVSFDFFALEPAAAPRVSFSL